METKPKAKKKNKQKFIKDDQAETLLETDLNKKHNQKRKHEIVDNNETNEETETENVKRKKITQELVDENDKKTVLEKKFNKKHRKKNKSDHENNISKSKETDIKNDIKKKKKQKLDNKEDESIQDKKHKKKRKQEETEENTSADYFKKKKLKVKKKQELSDSVDLGKSESSQKDKNKENTNKSKKKKKKKNKNVVDDENKEESETVNAKDSSLEYLKLWSEKRHQWKFQKVRKTWLLKHCYNKQKMPDEYFTILLRYLEGLKGRSKEITIKDAEKIMQKHEDMSDDEMTESNSIKCDRARQLIQLLS